MALNPIYMDIVETSPRSSVWPFIGGLVLGAVLVFVGLTTFNKSDEAEFDPAKTVAFGQKVELVGIQEDGKTAPTGLVVPIFGEGESWIYPYLVMSPDNKQVAYAVWQDGKMKIHVAKVDGSDDKVVTEQAVGAGIGEFVKESFGWGVTGKALYWQERQSVCGADGKPVAGVPSPYDCKQTLYLMYRLVLETGEKTIVDRKIW